MELPLIIVSVLGVVGLIVFLAHKAENARTEATRGIAEDLGLQFHAEGAPTLEAVLGKLRLFNQGRRRKFKNTMTGNANNVQIAIFEYRYTTGSGKHQHTHQQSVISFESEFLSLPDFEVRPEGMFHKIGQAFGYKDIDFETHPTFSKRFLLRGPNEPAIRDLFQPALLDFFEDLKKGVCVEAGNNRLIFYRAGKRLKPEQIRELMEEGFGVYGMLKRSEQSGTGLI